MTVTVGFGTRLSFARLVEERRDGLGRSGDALGPGPCRPAARASRRSRRTLGCPVAGAASPLAREAPRVSVPGCRARHAGPLLIRRGIYHGGREPTVRRVAATATPTRSSALRRRDGRRCGSRG